VNKLLRVLGLLVLGGVFILSSDLVAASLGWPPPITGLVMTAGVVLGYFLTVRAILMLTRASRWEWPVWLAAAAFGLLVVGALGHNIVSGLLGAEEAVFFLMGVWIAPALFVAAVVRMVQPPGGRSEPEGMGLSPQ